MAQETLSANWGQEPTVDRRETPTTTELQKIRATVSQTAAALTSALGEINQAAAAHTSALDELKRALSAESIKLVADQVALETEHDSALYEIERAYSIANVRLAADQEALDTERGNFEALESALASGIQAGIDVASPNVAATKAKLATLELPGLGNKQQSDPAVLTATPAPAPAFVSLTTAVPPAPETNKVANDQEALDIERGTILQRLYEPGPSACYERGCPASVFDLGSPLEEPGVCFLAKDVSDRVQRSNSAVMNMSVTTMAGLANFAVTGVENTTATTTVVVDGEQLRAEVSFTAVFNPRLLLVFDASKEQQSFVACGWYDSFFELLLLPCSLVSQGFRSRSSLNGRHDR